MRKLLMMTAALALFAVSSTVSAVQLKLSSFDKYYVQTTLNGTNYTGGGMGHFTVLEDFMDFRVGDELLALCLEPDEYITVGRAYTFEVVDLADAPTSGGFGQANADKVESIVADQGWADFSALSPVAGKVLETLLWEGGHDTVMDTMNGNMTFQAGPSTLDAQTLLTTPTVADAGVVGYGLLNIGTAGMTTRSVFRGQDFAFFQPQSVDEPMPFALLSLGMIGLAGFAR